MQTVPSVTLPVIPSRNLPGRTIISCGKEWTGIVKNLRKDGLYYWVYSHIAPVIDNDGKIIGYTAARRPATPAEVEEVIPVYKALLEEENK